MLGLCQHRQNGKSTAAQNENKIKIYQKYPAGTPSSNLSFLKSENVKFLFKNILK